MIPIESRQTIVELISCWPHGSVESSARQLSSEWPPPFRNDDSLRREVSIMK